VEDFGQVMREGVEVGGFCGCVSLGQRNKL
jgi:hypothetical protein